MPTPIPLTDTRYLVLEGDSNHAVRAASAGTIVIEGLLLDTREVQETCVAGAVVFDVGAYVGDTARAFLDRGCVVHAFEPFTDAFHCLLHNCPEALHTCEAVGDGREVSLSPACDRTYEWHADNYGTRGVAVHGSEAGVDITAPSSKPTLRLDDYVTRNKIDHLNFVKLDVEGFEPAVLDGAKETLARFRPVVLVEVFDNLLAKYGYTRADIFSKFPPAYKFRVAVGEETDDRCDFGCWPEEKYPRDFAVIMEVAGESTPIDSNRVSQV